MLSLKNKKGEHFPQKGAWLPMGWLNCDGIPDPKTRRFQELNGIYARLAAKGGSLREANRAA
jgi:hypothetical protein